MSIPLKLATFAGYPRLYNFTAVGSTLFFYERDSSGKELWKSDGTSAGTVALVDIGTGSLTSFPSDLTAVGNTLFFGADDGSSGYELWKSDGTIAGTKRLVDLEPGSFGSDPRYLTAVGNTLYFAANADESGKELWLSDGTTVGTKKVADVRPGGSSSFLENLTAVGSTLYFTADDGSRGYELWKSNGTSGGTTLVADISPGSRTSSYPRNLTAVGDTLFFTAGIDRNFNRELWKSDGTIAGTTRVVDITNPSSLTVVGDILYFTADDGSSGRELWKSDGTKLVADIFPGSISSYARNLTAVGNTLYFTADDGSSGRELWKSDGTSEGTTLVADIRSGGSSSPTDLTVVGNTLFFTIDSRIGRELWALDTSVTATTAAITAVTDDTGIIQGIVAEGARTNDTTPTITGTISAGLASGETLRIFNGSTLLGSATVDNNAKSWTFTPTLSTTVGTNYSITARVADASGNLGSSSTAWSFKLVVEDAGSVCLSLNDGKYWAEPIAAGAAPVPIRNAGVQIYTNIYGPQWQVLAADTVGGVNQVLWRETSVNRLHIWSLDDAWNRTASSGLIDPASAEALQLESAFQQDLNSDGVIAAPSTAVESAGSIQLLQGSGNRYSVQGTTPGVAAIAISKDGTQIYAGIYGNDWTVLAAETVNGANQVLWKNTGANRLHVWTLDANWNWTSSEGWDDTASSRAIELESQFGIDLNADGKVAQPSTSVEEQGSVWLIKGAGNTYSARSTAAGSTPAAIKKDGVQIAQGIYGSDWSVLAAETINGVNQVLWKNTGANRLHLWTLDANWSWKSSAGWDEPNSAAAQLLESQFGIDLDGNGTIASPDSTIDAAGATRLISSGTNRAYSAIANAAGSTAVPIRKDGAQIYAGIYGNDWTVLAAETINGVNQVLWKNTGANRLHVWSLDANWNWTASTGWDEPDSVAGQLLESQFGIDLDGNGTIASASTTSTTIENKGEISLLKGSGNRYSALSTVPGSSAVAITNGGSQIYEGIYGTEWQVLAADSISGVNQVLWMNNGVNRLHVWTLDGNWNRTASSGLINPLSGAGKELEAQFGIHTNADGIIRTYTPGSSTVDLITGTSTDEFFAPQGAATTGVDRIITGGGRNQIQLQASNGGNLYASNGEADLLLIEGFDSSKDELLVAANKAYGTTALNLDVGAGVGLYEDRNGNGIYNSGDELLALLKGTNSLPSGAIVLG